MMWVGNLVCCWQLIQYVFKTRSFDDKHANIQVDASPLDDDEAGNDTHRSAWFRKGIEKANQLSVSRGGILSDHGEELMGPGDHGSLGGTTLQDEKKSHSHTRIESGSVDGVSTYSGIPASM